MMKPLPSGPWEALFPRAILLIDEIERYGGASDPFWTLGGGTVKRRRDPTPCRHRELTPIRSLGRSAFLDWAGLVHQASPALGP